MALPHSGRPVAEDDPAVEFEFEDAPEPVSPGCRARVLAMAVAGPLITGYTAVAAVLALVTSVAASAHFSTTGVLAAAMPGWLAAHQVPLWIDGRELGVLPLLPTMVAVLLIGRAAAGAVHRLDLYTPRQAGQVVGAMVGGHAAFGLALGLGTSGGPVSVHPVAAFGYPALLAACGSVVGVARYSGLLDLAVRRLDAVVLRGLWVGLFAVAALLAVGALAVSIGLVGSVPAVRELFARNASGPGSGLGMLLLSVGYLPNAVLAGTSFVAGPGFHIGVITVAPLHFSGGSVPGLPLLAALPEAPLGWGPALLVLPVGIGALVGWLLREVAEEPLARLRAVAVATGVVVLCFLVLAATAGGALGGGRFDPVDLRAGVLSLTLLAWVGLTAAAVAWLGGSRPLPVGPVGLIDEPAEGSDEEEDEHENDEDEDEDGEEYEGAEEDKEDGEIVEDGRADRAEDDGEDCAAEPDDDPAEPAPDDPDLVAEIE